MNSYTAVPHTYLDECEELTDEEFGRLMRALLRYSMRGEPMVLSGNERFFARRMMNQEDVNAKKYMDVSQKRAEAGRKGAEARWQKQNAEAYLAGRKALLERMEHGGMAG